MPSNKIDGMNKKPLKSRLSPLFLAMAGIMPMSSIAEIIPDRSTQQAMNVATSANGTPLININNANNQGLSHNKYSEFDVSSKGVIFNNSMKDGASRTGGFAIKNNQLTREAQVILNEVTGAKGSYLNGNMEVFGRKADLIVANQNGITVNGVTTVNANNLTLSTGRVGFDSSGNLKLAVERGNVAVQGKGINTDGLEYFDIVSRSASLTGEIAGTADIKIVTGLNDYNVNKRSHTRRSATGADAPKISIDGSDLGSMYGGRIQLISTESGAGVNHSGSIIGNQGIEISAEGDIRLASLASKKSSVNVSGKSITLSQNKSATLGGISAQQDVILTALAGMTLSADLLAETGIIKINASSLLQSAATFLTKNNSRTSGSIPSIQINVSDRYQIVGSLYAEDSKGNIINDATVTLSNGQYVVKVGSTVIQNATVFSDASVISNSGNVAINATSMENNLGALIAKKGNLVVNLKDTLINNGSIQANGSFELKGRRLKNGGVLSTNDAMKITLGTLENSGSMYAGNISIITDDLNNQGVVIADNGDISLKVTKEGEAVNNGTLQASKALSLEGHHFDNGGVIKANGQLDINLKGKLTNSGSLFGDNATVLSSELVNQGAIFADKSLKIRARGETANAAGGTLLNQGNITTSKLDIDADKVINQDTILSHGDMVFTLGTALENNGADAIISASDGITIVGKEKSIFKVSNTKGAVIQSLVGDITIKNAALMDNVDANILSKKSLTLSNVGKVNNNGGLQAETVTIEDVDFLNNIGENAVITSNNVMNISRVGDITNKSGVISSHSDLHITNINTVSNTDGAVIQSSTGDVKIKNAALIDNVNADILAKNSLTLSNVKVVNNKGGLQAETINIQGLDSLNNIGQDAIIVSNKLLDISKVGNVTNESGVISSYGDLLFSNIINFINEAGVLSANNNITFNDVNLLENRDTGVISAEQGALIFNTLNNLQNLSGSVIMAQKYIALNKVDTIENSGDSVIQSTGNVSINDSKKLTNAATIISSASLIIKNVEKLLNQGEMALLQGLDIVVSKISDFVNTGRGLIISDRDSTFTEVKNFLNEAAAMIQANRNLTVSASSFTNSDYGTLIYGANHTSLSADKISNLAEASLISDNTLNITAKDIINDLGSTLFSKTYDINAGTLFNRGYIATNENSGKVNNGKSTITASLVDNTAGMINNADNLFLKTDKLLNVGGTVNGRQSVNLDLKGDFNNKEFGRITSANKYSITTTGNVTIDGALESYGSVHIKASNINNNHSIVSAGDIYLTANNIINNINSLIYSMKDMFLLVSDTFLNKEKGNILSQNTINITAGTLHNQAGVIRSEGDMWLDADKIHNESKYRDSSWDYSAYESITSDFWDNWAPAWNEKYKIKFSMPHVNSAMSLDIKAEISSGRDLNINQRKVIDGNGQGKTSAGITDNEGGLIQAARDLNVRGDLYNSPRYLDLNYDEYLHKYLQMPIILYNEHYKMAWSNKANLSFRSFYAMLDFIYSNGNDYTFSKGSSIQTDDYRLKFNYALKMIGNSHSILNTVMSKLFGGQWMATDFDALRSQWGDVKYNLADRKIYFLPAEKATMIAGRDFIHTEGAFNNGIASELAQTVEKNKVVEVDVADQTISSLDEGYEVKFDLKNIAEITMGIGTLPTFGKLIEIQGLFEKSADYINMIVDMMKEDGASATDDLNIGHSEGSRFKIIPMYETRPAMIDQSQYLGSDYFFDTIGYTSNKPVLVAGDAYFTSELIRRQLNDSVGSFFAVQYNLEGTDLVQMLFDNAGDYVSTKQGASLVVGQRLTKDQIDSLDRDIVWFVTEQIDGMDVLVPQIYLANTTIQDIQVVNETGTAVVHAGNNVEVDATNVNNANAVISAGNDINLKAEGDVNNISNGMNSGIMAGGSVNVTSETGDVINSGAQIVANEDISLTAEDGNVEIIASVGRNNFGEQEIGMYEDGITAGGDINIKAKEVDITGVTLTGGESEDSVIHITSTEGNVNFNDVHEVTSSYEFKSEDKGFLSHRSEETTTASANSVTNTVNTGGKFIVEAAEDAVFKGGEYNADSGSISAGNNVTFETSQDHEFKETVVKETSFEFGFSADLPGLDYDANYSTLDGGTESLNKDYQSAAGESDLSTAGHRPGSAPTAPAASFTAGLKTSETTTSESSTTNKNASFNFNQGADIHAEKTVDIGGMDLSAGSNSEVNFSGEDIISTKYEDVHTLTEEKTETFIGIKGEVHSSALDAFTKTENLIEKAADGMEVDGTLTAAQIAGDASNLINNDLVGGSWTAGWSQEKEHTTSTEKSENINNISGGTINFNSKNDTTLKGVEINANEVNVDAGGDFSLSAAESSSTQSSSSETLSAGVTVGGGASLDGSVGVGVSMDHNGSLSSTEIDSTSHTNSHINAGTVNINTGGDVNMAGANIVADNANLDIGGDLNVSSVQDTYQEDTAKQQWGASVGISVSTHGVLPNVEAHGGGGSESHAANLTAEQTGIHTSNALNVKTAGDLNMEGSHLISDNSQGSVSVDGAINVSDVKDNIDESGMYAGGGGGITKKGNVTLNGYVDTIDEKHYKEDQHSTINVDITKGDVKGELNTDASNMSTVTEDREVAGNNISFTVGFGGASDDGESSKKNKDKRPKKPGSDGSDGADNKGNNSHPVSPDTPKKPQTPDVNDNSHNASHKPGTEKPKKPQTPDVSDNSHNASQKPGSEKPKKPQTPDVSDNSHNASHKPGTENPKQPQTPDVSDNSHNSSLTPADKPNKWPTVQPVDPIIGGPGSSNRPGGNNHAGSGRPANNAPGHAGGNGSSVKPNTNNKPGTKWPTVKPVQPIIGGTGSASRPGGNNHAGGSKPANNSPASKLRLQNETSPSTSKKWQTLMDNKVIQSPKDQ